MAVQVRVTKLARNPKRRVARRNPKKRKRLTAKQIRFFGTKRQKAALKANRSHKHRHRAAANPKRRRRVVARANRPKARVKYRTRTVTKIKYRTRTVKAKANRRKRRSIRRNPAPVIVTLGATNPRRTMARKRKQNTSHHHRVTRTRSRNRKRVYVSARRRNGRRRSRNPITIFGQGGSKSALEMIGGGLLGMAGTKFLPTLAPSSISGLGGSTFGPVLLSGASAFLMKMLAGFVKKGAFQDAVFFGGLIQTGSTALNAFFPSLATQFGLGAIMPARFVVPQNPIRAYLQATGGGSSGPVAGPNARIGVSGLARGFGNAF